MTNEAARERAEQDGLYPCRQGGCWIPALLERGYVALFPLGVRPERSRVGNYQWSFQVHFADGTGGKVNDRGICDKHHKVLVTMMGREMANDVREQELTDEYITRNGGRL